MVSIHFIFALVFCFAAVDFALTRPPGKDDEGYKCPRPRGMFGRAGNCQVFYLCSENHPYLQHCPPGLYFDDVKKHCMRKSNDLKCGPVPLPEIETTTPDPLVAPRCDEMTCSLPNCFCSKRGVQIPKRIDRTQVPRIVTLSFDGALNDHNIQTYNEILNTTTKNPDGCPASFTFFITHSYTNYAIVQNMAARGHEIALGSVYGREPEDWWTTATVEEWKDQIGGVRKIIAKFGNISEKALVGMRAPFLKNGGNNMLTVAKDLGLTYDSSLAVNTDRPLWPYTFDHRMPHRCIGSRSCPTRSFPGIWEYPMNMMYSEDGSGGSCALADQCVFQEDSDEVYQYLLENFGRHGQRSMAPFGIYMTSNWFQSPAKVEALLRFIKTVQSLKDVYFVSIKKAIDWVKNPTTTAYPAFACDEPKPTPCENPNSCVVRFIYDGEEETRYMQTCANCPKVYPWVGNPEGQLEPGSAGPGEESEAREDFGEGEEYFEEEKALEEEEEDKA